MTYEEQLMLIEEVAHKSNNNAYVIDIQGDIRIDVSCCSEEEYDNIEKIVHDFNNTHEEFIDTIQDDQYFTCDYCDKNYYTENMYILNDNAAVACYDCLKDSELAKEYLEYRINRPDMALKDNIISDSFLKELGFRKAGEELNFNTYCDGSANATPQTPQMLCDEYNKKGYEVVFKIEHSDMFETIFTMHIRK